ncbi:MAG TPA: diguanylate cyclase [Opitutaceae bacterium]|nr:diguanylate cyclase [Opitutaceae bacterium]
MLRRVLLIDDDRAQFRLTGAQFKHFPREQYELEWAGTYEEGLAKLLGGGYAACLLDYQLGERDGLQLIREALTQGCRTPIVFLTAETSAKIDVEAMNAGALDYLVKGEITPRMLERSLRYAVKLSESFEALRQLATRDELTGLLNRREFDRILEEEHERAVRFNDSLALLMLDIDNFKTVNDAHGHPAGDVVLREVAGRTHGEVRNVDRVARFGGEEIGIIVVQSGISAALEIAERVRNAIKRTPIVAAPGVTVTITASIGVAVLPHDALMAEALLAAADKALYAAKLRGRDRVVAFSEAQ